MSKKPTRNDVAKIAGVSPAVVSYVLNGSNYVSPEKREAVERAIKELNYSPNMFARNLRMDRSRQIVLIGDTLQDGQDNLFALISKRLFKKGYYSSFSYSQLSDSYINMIIESRADGVIMASNSYSSQQLNRLVDNGIKVVLHQSREYEGLSDQIAIVSPDFRDGIRKAVDYLILKGHKQIGLISPIGFKTIGLKNGDFRTEGYIESMTNNGIEICPKNISTNTESVETICDDVLEMLSDSMSRPTALVVGDDYLAACIIQYLQKLGVNVPEDMAVIGWGDSLYSRITYPRLSTINCSVPVCAEYIVDKMICMLSGEKVENELVKVRLVLRESA